MGLGKVPIQKKRDFKARKRNCDKRKVPAPFQIDLRNLQLHFKKWQYEHKKEASNSRILHLG